MTIRSGRAVQPATVAACGRGILRADATGRRAWRSTRTV